MLRCRRVSLQNSWCLGDRHTPAGRNAHKALDQRLPNHGCLLESSPESDKRSLRSGLGVKTLKSSKANSTLHLGWATAEPGRP